MKKRPELYVMGTAIVYGQDYIVVQACGPGRRVFGDRRLRTLERYHDPYGDSFYSNDGVTRWESAAVFYVHPEHLKEFLLVAKECGCRVAEEVKA